LGAPETKNNATAVTAEPAQRPTAIRYRVLGLTFIMSYLMYMERAVMGAVTPSIRSDFHIDLITWGWCLSAFNWSYTLFQIPGGWMSDRKGARFTLAWAVAWWSVFVAGIGFSFSAVSLAVTRFLFGAGEAAAFPAGSRALVRWLPAEKRAFGQGFQHAGSRLGAALAPIIVAALLATYGGWRLVFFIMGGSGLVWAAVWWFYYRNDPAAHPGVNLGEVALLANAQPKPSASRTIPWGAILRSPDVWRLSFAYFCYGFVLWLYLNWFPTYLRDARHFSAAKGSLLASLPLLCATVTNVLGGIWSDKLTARMGDLRRGRVIVSMIGFVIAALGLLPGVMMESPVAALLFLSIALGGLELTVAVSWAICLDLGGSFSGSVASVMNTFGQFGGAISGVLAGYMAARIGWTSPFLLASAFCLIAALAVRGIDPRRSVAQ